MKVGLVAKRAALFAGSLFLFLGIVELFFSRFQPDRYYVWPPHFQKTFRLDPETLPGTRSPSHFTINALGMRGNPMDAGSSYRILTVGASTTICVYLDDSQAWPYLVQERLNAVLGPGSVWVGNVGRPGHTTGLNALQLEKLLAQHPEIDAVTLLVGAADLVFYLASTIDPDAWQQLLTGKPARALGVAFSMYPGWDDDWPWYLRNTLGRAWRLSIWRPLRVMPAMDDAGDFAKERRELRKQRSSLRRTPPPLENGIAGYVRNVNRLVDIAKHAGVRSLLITQPSLWRAGLSAAEEDSLWGGGPPMGHKEAGKEYYSVEVLAQTMEGYNRALLALCRHRGVECIDAAPQMPKTAEIFYDDMHYTEAGSQRLADIVAAYLLQSEPLGASAARADPAMQPSGSPPDGVK